MEHDAPYDSHTSGGRYFCPSAVSEKLHVFERSPLWSTIATWSMTYHLEVYTAYLFSDYLTFFLAYTLPFYPAVCLASIQTNSLVYFLAFYLEYCIYSDILSAIFSYFHSDIFSGICTWHMYLTFFLAFYLVYFPKFFVVEVRQGSLWSRGCCSGPAGPLRSPACSWCPAAEGGRGRGGGESADIEFNNPHLTRGEDYCMFFPTCQVRVVRF